MKMDISWHKNCLKNMIISYNNDFMHVQNLLQKLSKDQKEKDFYKYQIEEAEKHMIDSFDREKFRVKKNK